MRLLFELLTRVYMYDTGMMRLYDLGVMRMCLVRLVVSPRTTTI